MDISSSITVVCNILPSLVDQEIFFVYLANKVHYARFLMVCKKLCLISFGKQDNKLDIRRQSEPTVTHISQQCISNGHNRAQRNFAWCPWVDRPSTEAMKIHLSERKPLSTFLVPAVVDGD